MANRSMNKTSMKTTSGIELLAGIWLIISPFFMGYEGLNGAMWNSVIVGFVIAFLSGMRALREEGDMGSWSSWFTAVLGVWMILSPFIFNYSYLTGPLWNSIVAGAVVTVLAVWNGMSSSNVESRGQVGSTPSSY